MVLTFQYFSNEMRRVLLARSCEAISKPRGPPDARCFQRLPRQCLSDNNLQYIALQQLIGQERVHNAIIGRYDNTKHGQSLPNLPTIKHAWPPKKNYQIS
jgi:hypothetical protein